MRSSPSPKRPATTTSPGKRLANKAAMGRFTDALLEQKNYAELQMALKEKDIELQHTLNTLIALNEKLEVFNDLKKDKSEHMTIINDSEGNRTKLQYTITTTAVKVKENAERNEEYQNKLVNEINQLQQDIQDLHVKAGNGQQAHLDQLNRQDQRHHNEISAKDQTIAELKDACTAHNKQWQQEKRDDEARHNRERNEKNQEMDRAYQKFRDELSAEKNKHQKELKELSDWYLRTLKERNDKFLVDLKQLQDLLIAKEKQYLKETQDLRDQMVRQRLEHEEAMRLQNEKYKINIQEYNRRFEAMRIEKDSIITNLTLEMEQMRSTFELRIDELNIENKDLRTACKQKDSEILEKNTRLAQKEDVEEQLAMVRQHHDALEAAKGELQEQLESASSYIVQLEEKFYNSQTTQLEMLKQLKDTEFEVDEAQNQIDVLHQYIIDLKSRIAVYIPVKNDPTDKKLAEYINNYPDRQKLKIMFMRESEGVYQFGTKRIMVKVEKDNIKIRVGGGFLSLDEFLDQYTPAELEKLERKDPLRRMTDRIAIQKTIQGRATDSPTASSPGRASPQRGNRSPKKQRI